MEIQSAPRCVQCNSECPNGIKDFQFIIICQNPACPNYGLFQAGDRMMKELDELFPYKA